MESSLSSGERALSKVTVFVGLDYHKDSVQVCVLDAQGKVLGNRRCVNDVVALLRDQRIAEPEGISRWTRNWLAWLSACSELSEQSRWIVNRHVRRLEALVTEINEVMHRLREATAEDTIVDRLLELPGVGEVTAFVLRAEIGHFERFTSDKQLSRFCGLSPRNASSGNRQADAGLIKQASPALRTIVIEAAHRLIRYDDRWHTFAGRLRAAGKPGSGGSRQSLDALAVPSAHRTHFAADRDGLRRDRGTVLLNSVQLNSALMNPAPH